MILDRFFDLILGVKVTHYPMILYKTSLTLRNIKEYFRFKAVRYGIFGAKCFGQLM